MKIGTKSVLFGAHQFILHPLFIAYAWWRLYGFPWDPRLWLCFALHDLGYWGKPNMDGPEGEKHTEWAADIMYFFGDEWANMCEYHSRFTAKQRGVPYSKLCVADKLVVVIEPWWFYLPRVILSGEIKEYMSIVDTKHKDESFSNKEGKKKWFKGVQKYLDFWVYEHRNIKDDKFTKI